MFFIVTTTFLAGLAATRLLMNVGLDLLWLRYAIAVCAAYAVFLLMIRAWIWYVCSDNGGVDAIDAGFDFFGRAADRVEWVELGGGEFGGGGASGSWEGGDVVANPIQSMPVTSSSGSSAGKSWFSFDVDGDEGCVVVILVIALVAVLFFIGGYLIYTAPAILGEAAFEALLAAALARRTKRIQSAGWVGSVLGSTLWIFLGVLALTIVLGWYAQKSCPEARRIRDAINCGAVARAPLPD